jgi:hypothetical protein
MAGQNIARCGDPMLVSSDSRLIVTGRGELEKKGLLENSTKRRDNLEAA